MLRICSKCVVLHADTEFTVENRFRVYFHIVFQLFRFSMFSEKKLLNFDFLPYYGPAWPWGPVGYGGLYLAQGCAPEAVCRWCIFIVIYKHFEQNGVGLGPVAPGAALPTPFCSKCLQITMKIHQRQTASGAQPLARSNPPYPTGPPGQEVP